jgi:hypothetical protein
MYRNTNSSKEKIMSAEFATPLEFASQMPLGPFLEALKADSSQKDLAIAQMWRTTICNAPRPPGGLPKHFVLAVADLTRAALELTAKGAEASGNRISRAAYENAREAQLDEIRTYHGDYCERLKRQPRHEDDQGDRSSGQVQLQREAARKLGISYRLLIIAIETFLLDCAVESGMTAHQLVEKASSTDELIEMLRSEEREMIATHGPLWDE